MRKKRIASIDYGLKRIGLAISDENQIIASSLGVIEAGKTGQETIRKLLDVLKSYDLERIVVGYPIHLNGKIGFLADEVNHFISLLEKEVNCPVVLIDERLSTLQAERSLKEGGMNRKKRAKVVDAVSAVILLQCHLGY
ncbi:MAG: Holliday junction resolvase RuvX [Chlamydiales bacterium]|nr:Holliday junction resolvase RuvX [Chlamydiales bacterium]